MTDEEMTRLLAGKVMGWPTVTTYEEAKKLRSAGQGFRADIPSSPQGYSAWQGYMDPTGDGWSPLTRIVDAWQVQTAILRLNPGPFLDRMFTEHGAPRWAATAEDAARSICLAALRAVGVEVEE